MRTRIKICGITRWEDAAAAIDMGVDALGFVFVKSSPRFVSVEQARDMVSRLPPFVSSVGLFMNQSAREISEILKIVDLDLLQFHGEESPQDCDQFGRTYIKALPMGGNLVPMDYMANYPQSKGFLLDSHDVGGSGGSGHTFDWTKIPQGLGIPIILAGGLDALNVADAIEQTRPYAVDVSSGVEQSKGIKDINKMKAFVDAVRAGETN